MKEGFETHELINYRTIDFWDFDSVIKAPRKFKKICLKYY